MFCTSRRSRGWFSRGVVGWLLIAGCPLIAEATRLVTATPLITQLVRQLGKGKDIVAGSVAPPETAPFPSLGPLFMPSAERTLLLSPDWVISDPLTPALYLSALTALKVPHVELKIQTVDQLFTESKRLLATLYGDHAPRVIIPFQQCWKDVTSRRSVAFRFLAFTWLSPPILFGSRSFLSDFLTQIGGFNAAAAIDFDYPQISEEWILDQTVDYVFYLSDEYSSPSEIAKQISRWWPNQKPKLIPLPSSYFAQSNFAAWSYFKKLPLIPTTEACASL
jgi:ABC-type Fe3+-hydroxamate transport system substrate-binding protein